MIELGTDFLTEYGSYTPYIVFASLVLAAFNVPISEDLLVITCGVFVKKIDPGLTVPLYIGLFLGAVVGDLLLFIVVRKIGQSILTNSKLHHIVPTRKIEWVTQYFHKHAYLTIAFGRMLPGIRNAVTVTAAITHFPIWRFWLIDCLAALFTTGLLYILSLHYGALIINDIKRVQYLLSGLFGLILLLLIWKMVRFYAREKRN